MNSWRWSMKVTADSNLTKIRTAISWNGWSEIGSSKCLVPLNLLKEWENQEVQNVKNIDRALEFLSGGE